MADSNGKYWIKGELKEEEQTFLLPIFEAGIQKPWLKAGYHLSRFNADYEVPENLTYLAIPSGTRLEIGETEISIPFKIEGEIVDVSRFGISPYSISTEGLAFVKIRPGVPFRVKARDRILYHSFEMLETPDSYKNPEESHLDFAMLSEEEKRKLSESNSGSDWAMLERGNRIIIVPGVTVYPENCASRIPGWLAKEFNGSPELGFAYSPFRKLRKGEVLHYHQEVVEPYLGIKGKAPLFIAIDEGSEKIRVADLEGKIQEIRGEVVEIRNGDIVIPLPGVKHKIVFEDERAKFPFTMYCLNYAKKPLNEVPLEDRVVLEKKE